MKKSIFISAACLFIVCATHAQTEKGSWAIGATLGSGSFAKNRSNSIYSTSPTEFSGESSSFSFNMGPFGMFFLKDNLAIGPRIGFSFSNGNGQNSNTSSQNVGKEKSNSTTINIGPQIRQYFGKPGSKGQPWVEVFGDLTAGTNNSKNSNSMLPNSAENSSKSSGWQAGLGVGYSHFFNSHIAMQYYVNFRHVHSHRDVAFTQTQNPSYSYSADINNDVVGFGVGFAIHLPSKK